MRKIALIVSIIIICIFILYVLDSKNKNFYHKKFEDAEPNCNMKSIIKKWGEPSEKFDYDNDEIVFFYKKDWLGWEKYVFVFNKRDSLFVRKSIDD